MVSELQVRICSRLDVGNEQKKTQKFVCFSFKDLLVVSSSFSHMFEKKKSDSSHFNCTRELPHRRCIFRCDYTIAASGNEIYSFRAHTMWQFNRFSAVHFVHFAFHAGAPIRVAERIKLKPIY